LLFYLIQLHLSTGFEDGRTREWCQRWRRGTDDRPGPGPSGSAQATPSVRACLPQRFTLRQHVCFRANIVVFELGFLQSRNCATPKVKISWMLWIPSVSYCCFRCRYEKSYMHRDVVTHVAVSAADFFITGSSDGIPNLNLWLIFTVFLVVSSILKIWSYSFE